MDPFPLAAASALTAPLRRLLVQGVQLIGAYGWTWVEWYEHAQVPPAVLHHALQGRIIDEPACLRLAAALGWTLAPDALDPHGCTLAFRLPLERLGRAPMPTLPCPRCGVRGLLAHQRPDTLGTLDTKVRLACRGCGHSAPLLPVPPELPGCRRTDGAASDLEHRH